MTEHHEELLELCAGLALGALDPSDEERLRAHLETGCTICGAELARASETALELARGLRPVPPPPALKDAVLASLGEQPAPARTQPWRDWDSTGEAAPRPVLDPTFLTSTEGDWEPTGVDGITVRRLWVDRERDHMTALFRMDPGTSYFPHRHAGAEECFVLEGDLRVGERTLRAGDYQHAPEGSVHGVQSTADGCLLLISGSLLDEPL